MPTVEELMSSIQADAGVAPTSPEESGVPADPGVEAEANMEEETALVEEFRTLPPEEAALALKELVRMFVGDLT